MCTELNAHAGAKSADKALLGAKPNIIIVLTDDQGLGDLSFSGNKILRTPNIDRFAKDAVRFNDFQVSPTCAPTRAALMSGRPPFKVGVTHTIKQRERLALEVFTMPQALQSAGYETGLFGKWHLGDDEQYLPQARGFDEVLMHGAGGIGQTGLGDFPPNKHNQYFDNVLLHNDTIVQTQGFCTDLFFDAALAWIKVQHDADKPYFAYVSLNAPHAPAIAPDKYKKRFLADGYDDKTAARYGMIENIGRLLTKLAQWQALDNTLIIFMTDNGMSMKPMVKNGVKVIPYNAGLKGRKNSPFEGGTHVPMYWQWRFVNNNELYDITIDPGEKNNLAATHPKIVNSLRSAYDQWWASAVPLMVNENLPKVGKSEQPLVKRYNQQLKDRGLPLWTPNDM